MSNLELEKRFGASCRNFLVQAGIQAYEYGAEILETTILGGTERGLSLFPHLINVLYDYNVRSLCNAGEIPFIVQECTNVAKNSFYFLFVGKQLEFTISRTQTKDGFPRQAAFRNNYAENNDLISLFPELEPERKSGRVYAILTHGGRFNKLDFARIGIPRKDTRSWIGTQWYLFDRTQKFALMPEFDSKPIKIARPKLKSIEDALNIKIK